MKNPVIHDDIARKLGYTCCVCDKKCDGWYGANDIGGTCSGTCERTYASRPRWPEHTEEDFLKRFNLGEMNGQTQETPSLRLASP